MTDTKAKDGAAFKEATTLHPLPWTVESNLGTNHARIVDADGKVIAPGVPRGFATYIVRSCNQRALSPPGVERGLGTTTDTASGAITTGDRSTEFVWRNIKDAPKDGTRVVLFYYFPRANGQPFTQIGWFFEGMWWSMLWDAEGVGDGWTECAVRPRAWFPLPAIPPHSAPGSPVVNLSEQPRDLSHNPAAPDQPRSLSGGDTVHLGILSFMIERLREYAAAEHGKRAKLHGELSSIVFEQPLNFAQTLAIALSALASPNPPDSRNAGLEEAAALLDLARQSQHDLSSGREEYTPLDMEEMIGSLANSVRALKRAALTAPQTPKETQQDTGQHLEHDVKSAWTLLEERARQQNNNGVITGATSFVQRHMRLGYNTAARLLEELERQMIVTAPNEKGERKLLTTPQTEGKAK